MVAPHIVAQRMVARKMAARRLMRQEAWQMRKSRECQEAVKSPAEGTNPTASERRLVVENRAEATTVSLELLTRVAAALAAQQ